MGGGEATRQHRERCSRPENYGRYVNAQTNLSSSTQNAARQIYGLLGAELGHREIQVGPLRVKTGQRPVPR
jgi:hypothetical protein